MVLCVSVSKTTQCIELKFGRHMHFDLKCVLSILGTYLIVNENKITLTLTYHIGPCCDCS